MKPPRAPAWIGIGAQRSGTTWFTQLLLRHPDVCLTSCRSTFIQKKELHYFDGVLHSGINEDFVKTYHQKFANAEGNFPGEFTPSYLRCTWTAGLVQQAIARDTVIVCMLRDPVERFHSAIRHSQQASIQNDQLEKFTNRRGELSRLIGADAIWGGMYATQLNAWKAILDINQFVVLQYEAVVKNPAGAVSRVWSAMGLSDVDIGPALPPSETSSSEGPTIYDTRQTPGLDSSLRKIYYPEILELEKVWGIDRGLWTAPCP